MSEQTFSALTLLASATTGTNNFLMVSTRTKKTHSQPKQTEETFTALKMLHVNFLPHRSQSRHHGQAFCESSRSRQPRPDKCVTKSVILCYAVMLTTNIKLMSVSITEKNSWIKRSYTKKHTNHTYKCTDPTDTHKHIHLSKIVCTTLRNESVICPAPCFLAPLKVPITFFSLLPPTLPEHPSFTASQNAHF